MSRMKTVSFDYSSKGSSSFGCIYLRMSRAVGPRGLSRLV